MRYGNRTEAAEFGDPDAMLARFEPGPDRVARVVLHPRLSFVPCAAADFEAFRRPSQSTCRPASSRPKKSIDARTSGSGTADIAGSTKRSKAS